jgi:predicted DNA-binding transcriptional regulator YafY
MALINTIYDAIGGRRVLSFTYKGTQRTAEPYIVGYDDKQRLVLSAVQLSGGSGKGFRNFGVDEISDVSKTDRTFFGKHPDYNPRDPYFAHVLKQV